jgi:polar amino acid transport system substrate-binding protein
MYICKNSGAGLAAIAFFVAFNTAQAQSITFLTEENPPFNFTQAGKPAGISTEIITEMIKRADLKARFEILHWDTAYRRAQADKDTCLYSTARLAERERLFRWIGPITNTKWVLVAKSDFSAAINNDADARKYKIGAIKTDAKAEFLRAKAITNISYSDTEIEIPPKLFLPKDDPARIDLWVSGLHAYQTVAVNAKVTGIKTVYVVGEQPLFLACSPRTADDVFNKLRTAEQSMRKDGTWNKLITESEKRFAK